MCTGAGQVLDPRQVALLRLVFVKRRRAEYFKTLLLATASKSEGGASQKDLKSLLHTYTQDAFPFLDLEAEEKRALQAIHDELQGMSNQMLAFRVPSNYKDNKRLKGPGAHLLEEMHRRSKR